MMQLYITFGPQNSPENQHILDLNKSHLSRQCQIVYMALLSGERLTTFTAMRYGIGDLRARVRDLIKEGIPVQKKLIDNRYKEYFL